MLQAYVIFNMSKICAKLGGERIITNYFSLSTYYVYMMYVFKKISVKRE